MQYSVLIIDDNQMTVKSLCNTIDWEELGLRVAGTAFDGTRGAEMIRTLKPDIIITDIYMPTMDGLQMIEEVQGDMNGSRIIFITGYDKFQYASKAIKLSAFDFLLKPIDNRELTESLKKAVISLDNERNNFNRQKKSMLSYRGRSYSLFYQAGSRRPMRTTISGNY